MHRRLAHLERVELLAALAAPALDEPVFAATEQSAPAIKQHMVDGLRMRLQLVHDLAALHVPYDHQAGI